MIAMRLFPFVTALALAFALSGCASPTYINIPAERGDAAFHSPNGRTVVALSTQALDAVATASPTPLAYEFVLPRGATIESYAAVAEQLGDLAIIPAGDTQAAPADFPLYEVRAIRVRGGTAEVDVIQPGVGNTYQLVEVFLKWSAFDGWHAVDQRPRRILVQPPVRPQLDLMPNTSLGTALPPATAPATTSATQP